MPAINQVSENDIRLFVQRPLFSEYARLATRSAIYPGQGTPLGLAYVALKMNGEAGEFAEHVGKAMRDDALIPALQTKVAGFPTADLSASLTPERRDLLIKEIGDVLWYLAAACRELGTTLDAVAYANLVKLADRSRRNTLQGSGDER
jgi:NTP pyrophosphatase (non-canonical NTP hydrolase)